MSGIAGLWRLDGSHEVTPGLAAMLNAQAHRGPDGIRRWQAADIGLGHCALSTTPESLAERLPLQGLGGTVVLTADLRLDNRSELIRRLRLHDRPAGEIGDGELLLSAYLTWGESCPEHLLGDFAFALWDAGKRQVFCARDHFGVRPFQYHFRPGRLFAFASEIKGVVALPEVPRDLSEWWIARFLTVDEDDLAATVYEQVYRLPPAHTLTVTAERAVLRRYWSLDPELEVRRGSSGEYEEEFREIFFEAVRCRLRSAGAVGSMLSGGLDSSSIACVARDVLANEGRGALHTFSWVFESVGESDERRFIETVLRQGGMVPHYIRTDDLRPVADVLRFAPYLDGPMRTANVALNLGMASAVRQAGARVVLSGHFGDDAVSHGLENLAEMVRGGQVLGAALRGYQYARNFEVPLSWVYRRLAFGPALPPGLWRVWKRLRGLGRGHRPQAERERLFDTVIGEDLRQRTATMSRSYPTAQDPDRPRARRGHYHAIVQPILTNDLQVEDLVSAAYGTEVRYPFFDLRLVEFAYGLPSAQKLQGGWSRSILRRSLASVLPPEVCWRTDKGNLSHWYVRQIADVELERIRETLSASDDLIRPYVNTEGVRALLERGVELRSPGRFVMVWFALSLAIWLRGEQAGTGGTGRIASATMEGSELADATVFSPMVAHAGQTPGNLAGSISSRESQ
jgi:asparagine synthase (glutamine-hydrolysing)